ncbi:MAG: hypothetical protein M1161_02940 [Candidatus Thermoplasmatota archaeon]|jgi:hypothetical protein|nr:hypothetical protein [Candidatus Thermoplasmatota archaeon]
MKTESGNNRANVERLDVEVKHLRKEVENMKVILRGLLQVVMENEEEDDYYEYT